MNDRVHELLPSDGPKIVEYFQMAFEFQPYSIDEFRQIGATVEINYKSNYESIITFSFR